MTHQEFKERFLPYYKKMYYLAFRYLGNENDAEDMVQDAYLKLWEKRNELNSIDNTEAYAITIVKNLCLDRLRRTSVETDSETTLIAQIDPSPPPDTAYEEKEDIHRLLEIISTLPLQQQQVVLLRHFENKATEEIETETGLTNNHIRVLLSRARKTIKELFIQ